MYDYKILMEIKENLEKLGKDIDRLVNDSSLTYNPILDKKIAVYSITQNCTDFLLASIKSLLVNSDVDKIYVLVDSEEFPQTIPDVVEPVNANGIRVISPVSPNLNTRFTIMCLNRLGYAKIFPTTKRILSLDYDVIVKSDISDVWNTDLGEKYLMAGVPERDRTLGYQLGYFNGDDFSSMSNVITKEDLYVNAGVMLLNLAQIRAEKLDDVMLEEVNNRQYKFPEQDIYNIVCRGRIYPLDNSLNVSRFTYSPMQQKIVHYAGEKKSLDIPLVKHYNDLSWDSILEHRAMRYGK